MAGLPKGINADISIHVPREGHDHTQINIMPEQSYFNPRAPRGARRMPTSDIISQFFISIHVPREGHDETINRNRELKGQISIHVPREGHDSLVIVPVTVFLISIDVPREGHDSKHAQFFRADLRKSYKYPAERDALPTKNVCKHIKTLG